MTVDACPKKKKKKRSIRHRFMDRGWHLFLLRKFSSLSNYFFSLSLVSDSDDAEEEKKK